MNAEGFADSEINCSSWGSRSLQPPFKSCLGPLESSYSPLHLIARDLGILPLQKQELATMLRPTPQSNLMAPVNQFNGPRVLNGSFGLPTILPQTLSSLKINYFVRPN